MHVILVFTSILVLNVANAREKHTERVDKNPLKQKKSVLINKRDTPVLPLATGTFWQIGVSRIADWSDEELAAEVAVVKNAGMDVIMIHYGAIWDTEKRRYHTYIPNSGFSPFGNLGDRNPLKAIFTAAEKLGMKIILADFLIPPNLRYDQPKEALKEWLSPQAMAFRTSVINRYKNSSSFFGYYIPNEPNPHRLKTQEDKDNLFAATKQVAAFVKNLHPALKVIHSIGLYPEWKTGNDGISRPYAPSPAYLESFWGRWINEIKDVDAWMIIDGIGTKLASLRSTDTGQAWAKEATHRAGKEYWVDVENAVMNKKYYPFTIEQLTSSLEVAAKHADKIVLFEHLNYMSPNNNKPAAKKLHDDYLLYRNTILRKH